MCEDPGVLPLIGIDVAVAVCENIKIGKAVDADDVLDIRGRCFIDPVFLSELRYRLKMEDESIQELLRRAVYISA